MSAGLLPPQPWRAMMEADARALRVARGALKRVRRVGSNVGGVRSEESEIAVKALRRIARCYPKVTIVKGDV